MNSVIKEPTDGSAWRAELEVAQLRTTNKMSGVYDDHTKPAVRSGADDHQKYPSLRGKIRFFQDGREEKVKR
tara:strand:+ start:105 stop:320 length:216 start_codon:yes stop_codon:yes gene_type:complete